MRHGHASGVSTDAARITGKLLRFGGGYRTVVGKSFNREVDKKRLPATSFDIFYVDIREIVSYAIENTKDICFDVRKFKTIPEMQNANAFQNLAVAIRRALVPGRTTRVNTARLRWGLRLSPLASKPVLIKYCVGHLLPPPVRFAHRPIDPTAETSIGARPNVRVSGTSRLLVKGRVRDRSRVQTGLSVRYPKPCRRRHENLRHDRTAPCRRRESLRTWNCWHVPRGTALLPM